MSNFLLLPLRPLRGGGDKGLATKKKITFLEALKKIPKKVATKLEGATKKNNFFSASLNKFQKHKKSLVLLHTVYF